LGHLGLARTYAASGEKAKGRAKYQEFFALRKDADAGVPLLSQAKAEYRRVE
jgi:hypothetical protein